MKIKFYTIVGLPLFIALSTYFISKKSISFQDPSVLVIGTASGYAPWVSINEHGEYEGFDIDVMTALANQMNKKLILKDLGSMPSLFIALEQNKIDAIIWGMSITKDRLNRVAMIHYQGSPVTSFPLLFWGKIPDTIKSAHDMAGKTVCVEPASAQDTVLSNYPFIKKLPTERVDDALLQLQYAKADAAFVEPVIAKKFKNKYPILQILNVPLALEDQVHGVGICIKKSNALLINQVQKAVHALQEKNIIKTLESKWNIS